MLEKKNYLVIRSSGSHGPADLVSFSNSHINPIWLIQCKTDGKLPKQERMKLQAILRKYPVQVKIAYRDKNKVVIKDLLEF